MEQKVDYETRHMDRGNRKLKNELDILETKVVKMTKLREKESKKRKNFFWVSGSDIQSLRKTIYSENLATKLFLDSEKKENNREKKTVSTDLKVGQILSSELKTEKLVKSKNPGFYF